MSPKSVVEKRIKEIRRNTRRKYSAEEKIRIVLEGLRGAVLSVGSFGLVGFKILKFLYNQINTERMISLRRF